VKRFAPSAVDAELSDPRRLMGYVSGWMYIAVGVIGLVGLVSPSLRFHLGWQLGLGLASVAYVLLTVVDVAHWGRRPMAVHIAAMAVALPVMVLALWASGGHRSYLRPVLLLAPIHWGFFLRDRRVLAALCAGFILTYWAPVIYEHAALSDAAIANTATLSLTVVFVASSLSLIRRRLDAAEDELIALARIDPLTGLLNRRSFGTELNKLVESACDRVTTYVVLLDLDHLKRLNDTHGHHVGDIALRRFAERLAATARAGDAVARLGGDEFALAGHTLDPDAVERIASRLQGAVSGMLDEAGGVPVEATTGWAVDDQRILDDAAAASELLRAADARLLESKRTRCAGRDSDLSVVAA
jgi:diguanylate cyclase (GGDEF)-like protein